MDACPPLEDIAAFLDDTLSPEEREQIAEHLARCESCYEVFAGAAHFELEPEEKESSAKGTGGGGVIPFPLDTRGGQIETEPAPAKDAERQALPARRRPLRWLPLAASVVLAAGLGFFAWQSFLAPPKVILADLVKPLEKQPEVAENLYLPEDVLRGANPAVALLPHAPSFLAGVYLIDLRLSAQAEEVKKTQDTLYSLSGELAQSSSFTQDLATRVEEKAGQLTDADALRRFVADLPQLENEIHENLSPEPFFSFGLWTEAGRLSAVTRSPDFFKSRANRRFISSVRQDLLALQDPRYDPVVENLRRIESRWTEGASLAALFKDIIDRIEQIQKEDAEEFGLA